MKPSFTGLFLSTLHAYSLTLLTKRVWCVRPVQMVTHVPALPVLDLEVTKGRWLPEEIVSKHSQQSEENSGVQEPCTSFSFTKRFEKRIDLTEYLSIKVNVSYLLRKNELNLREIELLR